MRHCPVVDIYSVKILIALKIALYPLFFVYNDKKELLQLFWIIGREYSTIFYTFPHFHQRSENNPHLDHRKEQFN